MDKNNGKQSMSYFGGCLLLIFTNFNSKFKVTFRNGDFQCQYIGTHSGKKPFNTSNITYAILPFSHPMP